MAKGSFDYQYFAYLAARIRLGDESAFTELYTQTYPTLYRYVYYFMRDPDSTQDVLQEIYISIFKNIGSLKIDRLLPSWIRQIAYHACCDAVKQRSSMGIVLDYTDENLTLGGLNSYSEAETFQSVFDKDASDRVRAVLDKRPQKERQAFLLRYENGLKLEEIADFMDVSLASVKRYIQSARKALQKSLPDMKS